MKTRIAARVVITTTLLLVGCGGGNGTTGVYRNCTFTYNSKWMSKSLELQTEPALGNCPVNAAPGQSIQTGGIVIDKGATFPGASGDARRASLIVRDNDGEIGGSHTWFMWELSPNNDFVRTAQVVLSHNRGGDPTYADFDVAFEQETGTASATMTIVYYSGNDQ